MIMTNVNNRLKSTLCPKVFPAYSDREKRSEDRNIQKIGDTGEKNPVSISPPSGNADENTIKWTSADVDVSALTQQQKYVHQTKASEKERA